MIYVTSDLHFYHNKSFIYEPRGFKNVYDMNEEIIKNWNKIITPEDDVYILGDIMLNDDAAGLACLHQLNGKLHIVWGNHDTENRKPKIADSWNVVETDYIFVIKYQKYTFYLSHYPTVTSNYDVDKPLKARIINLCGHTHDEDPFCDWNKGLIYHCELDAHNNQPILLDNIIKEIKDKLN